MKKFFRPAFIYAIVAMLLGAFSREFTKFAGFEGSTRLFLLHTHYFVLGMVFFLLAAILQHLFSFADSKKGRIFPVFYHVGLNITGISFFIRGMLEVLAPQTIGLWEGALSGIGGVGHICIGTGIVLFFLALLEKTKTEKA